MKKIHEKLTMIQQTLKTPKSRYNQFGKYNYRSAEDILEAVKPHLDGLALIINDEPVLIGDRFYIKATVTLTDGEESVSATAYAREDDTKKGMDGCQITGACSSYARKYALNALLMIDDSKDSDDDSLSPKNPANKPDKEDKPPELPPMPEQRTPPKADTEKVDSVPAINEQVMAFLNSNAKMFMEPCGIANVDDMKRRMEKWRKSLVAGGVIEDIPFTRMTLAQAEGFIDAVMANDKVLFEVKK